MRFAKVIAELTTLDFVSGWIIFTEMSPVPYWIEVGLKVVVAISLVTYNIVKTIKVLKTKDPET